MMVPNCSQKSSQEEGLSGESLLSEAEKKKCCSDCKVTRTPCWRNGPCGPKTMCNACGLKYAKKKRQKKKGMMNNNNNRLKMMNVMFPLEKELLLHVVVKKKQRSPRQQWGGGEVERAALVLMSLSSSASGALFAPFIHVPSY